MVYPLKSRVKHLEVVFQGMETVKIERGSYLICFSVKAASSLAILKIFINLGGGTDIVSGGELFRALNANVEPGKVVFSGVGKQIKELEYALKTGILMFNVESPSELTTLNQVAGRLGKKAKIALRVNPHIDPKTHPYISTGLRKNKFGIEATQAIENYREAKKLEHLEIIGVDCHIGSQITELNPFVEALRKVKELVQLLRKENIEIKYIDLGGGLGITYQQEQPPHPREYAEVLIKEMKDLNCTLILEPGRVIAGNAGILVSKVLYLKQGTEKSFVIVDAAMNDLIRPSLYAAFQAIQPVVKNDGDEMVVDIVGPICESGDFLAQDRKISRLKPNDLIAVMSAGAYGFTMSSNYNSRPRVPEVLVGGKEFYVIRERESYQDLIRGEKIPEFLNQ